MKFQAFASIPIFLGQAGMGQNFGQIAPQIKMFDVYYRIPPVVGFHIIGISLSLSPVTGIVVFERPYSENTIGFEAFDDTKNSDSSTFVAEYDPNAASVRDFTAEEDSGGNAAIIATEEEDKDPLVQSFIVEEDS